jgi:uncharacterized membrane protein YjjB (DUF3815 family)
VKNTKFIALILGLIATVLITLAGKMTGEVATLLGSLVIGFYGGNVINTRAALSNGKDAHE